MNPISKALDEMKFRIPAEALRVTFLNNDSWRNAPISLDQEIVNKVIKPRVLIDCNIVGGQTIIVSLERLSPKYLDSNTVVYEIPGERLMNRSLMSVLSVGYVPFNSSFGQGSYGNGVNNTSYGNDVSSAAQRVGDSFSSVPVTSSASVELIGNNVIMIKDRGRTNSVYQLRCIIGNEENLNNLNPRSYLHFAKLCELAVKSYVYNKMLIAMDTAFLAGGQDLGAFRSYIETLSDSEEMYQTYIKEVWSATMFMNSQVDHTRFIRSMLSPGI